MTGVKNVPRTANEQYKAGKVVTSDPQPGDLLFWEGTQKNLAKGQASHVAVYLGNGQIANAGSRGVEIRPVAGYMPRKFIGIRRFSK